MAEFELCPYVPENRKVWNACVRASRKANFLFEREFMEYHADRFPDASFLVKRNGNVVGCLPGTLAADGTWSSHAGLTFGGFVHGHEVLTSSMLVLFDLLDTALRDLGARRVLYKPVPAIYTKGPCEEDLYALFRRNATLVARQVSTVIVPGEAPVWEPNRRRYARRAQANGVQVGESSDWESFWDLLTARLHERFGAAPVHRFDEILKLARLFPQQIRLLAAMRDSQMLSGTVLFLSERVVRSQYIATSAEGRSLGALDAVMAHLLEHPWVQGKCIDMGTSNAQGGRELNEGLVAQKEGFGARAQVADTYGYDL